MELITKEVCIELLIGLDHLAETIEQVISNNKPSINGERYLSDSEVCNLLNICKKNFTGIPGYETNTLYTYLRKDNPQRIRSTKNFETELRTKVNHGIKI